jgi:hypothetical protein
VPGPDDGLLAWPAGPVSGEQTFTTTETYEVEATPWLVGPVEPLSDFWYWTSLYTTGQPVSRTLVVEASGVAAGPGEARLEVALQGGSETIGAHHRVSALLNGYYLGGDSFSSFDQHVAAFEFDQALLREGTNQVELVASLEGGLERSLVFVDHLALTYQRTYETFEPWLLARTDGQPSLTMTVGGGGAGRLGQDVLLLEVSDPMEPKVVTGASVRSSIDGRLVVGLVPSSPDDVPLAASALACADPRGCARPCLEPRLDLQPRHHLAITTAGLRQQPYGSIPGGSGPVADGNRRRGRLGRASTACRPASDQDLSARRSALQLAPRYRCWLATDVRLPGRQALRRQPAGPDAERQLGHLRRRPAGR